ncbi:MAG: hypothetical protein QXY49_06665 [Thermofilaceae archaeon]
MKETKIILRKNADETTNLLAVSSEAQRIIIVVEADDKTSAIEKLRDFLLSNIDKTIVVYASNLGGEG